MLHSHFLSKIMHGGSSNGHTYFEDLDEDEPETSESLGEISCKASEGWKRAEGRGCTISPGENGG